MARQATKTRKATKAPKAKTKAPRGAKTAGRTTAKATRGGAKTKGAKPGRKASAKGARAAGGATRTSGKAVMSILQEHSRVLEAIQKQLNTIYRSEGFEDGDADNDSSSRNEEDSPSLAAQV